MNQNMIFRQSTIQFLLFSMLTILPFTVFSKDKGSKFGGVQIGITTYSYRSMPDQTLPAVLNYLVESGLNSVELKGDPLENYLGIPGKSDLEGRKAWRASVSMKEFKRVRKMFKNRGVDIDIVKFEGGITGWSDVEIDYAFAVCKALGARGISMEISENVAKRFAPFANKHKRYVILHNHGQPGNPDFSFDRILSYGPYLMLNLDVGHYWGATGIHPNVILERLHHRIASIHLKDKTGPAATDPNKNKPWGEGETPIQDILQLIKKNKWPITCDIELEHTIPGGSDAVKEVIKCVEYCKKCLLNDSSL